MIGAAAVGYLRDKLGVVWRLRSLWAKMSLLAVIFALVPLFLYFEFSKAYQDSQDLLAILSARDTPPLDRNSNRHCAGRRAEPSRRARPLPEPFASM